jgi:hypothetical protein
MLRFGRPPYVECSSHKGGYKRLSAFYAYLRSGKSIETIYQAAKVFADGSTDLPWREAKGRTPINVAECRALYSALWGEYMAYPENRDLVDLILSATGLSDVFGQEGRACQAEELWRIREALLIDEMINN